MPNFHTPRLIRGIWLFNIALLCLLGYKAATGPLGQLAGPQPPTPRAQAVPAPQSPPEPPKQREQIDPQAIVDADPFGTAARAEAQAVQQPPAEPVQEKIVEQPPQLKLLGTIAGDSAVARAVIEDTTSNTQDFYRVGDEIQNAEITDISRGRVVLVYGQEQKQHVLAMSLPNAPQTTMVAESDQPEEPAIGQLSQAVQQAEPEEYQIDKQDMIARVDGIESMLRRVNISPYVEQGNIKGLRVHGIGDLAMAELVGLKDGDVIQSVNGQSITSRQKAFQILRKARNQKHVDVRILRGNSTRALSFGIR